MFRYTLAFWMALVSSCAQAQLLVTEPDRSPMDMSYAPHNYPILKFQSKTPPVMPLARVIYSRPQKAGRQLFGSEIRYNELWRLGANESTEIEFFVPASFGGKRIAKGRYTLYCIPTPQQWTLIVSRDNYSWGAFSYKPANDVLRVNVPVGQQGGAPVEYFTMYFDNHYQLIILWDEVRVEVPVKFDLPK